MKPSRLVAIYTVVVGLLMVTWLLAAAPENSACRVPATLPRVHLPLEAARFDRIAIGLASTKRLIYEVDESLKAIRCDGQSPLASHRNPIQEQQRQ